jgi:DNA polymerase delta subunit 1
MSKRRAREAKYAAMFEAVAADGLEAAAAEAAVEEDERIEMKRLRDSNETNSRFAVPVEEDDRVDDHRHDVDHMAQALLEQEQFILDREADAAVVPVVVVPGAPPAPAARRGFQADLDYFDGDADTDNEDGGPGVVQPVVQPRAQHRAHMPVSTEEDDELSDLLNPLKHRIGPAYPGPGYERPPALDIDPATEDFVFMLNETTYDINSRTLRPDVRAFGTTETGNSVMAIDPSFQPYFFVEVSSDWDAQGYAHRLNEHFARTYTAKQRNGRVENGKFVVRIERGVGRSMCGYHCGRPLSVFYKFVMAHPAHVAVARDCFEFANSAITERPIKTYEANVPFELRWMIDKRIHGCQWVRLRKGTYSRVPVYSSKSTAQYELMIHDASGIEPIELATKSGVAPMRILSYDIEVLRRRPGFPTAKEDPCIMIACALQIMGTGVVHKVIFTTRPNRKKTYGPLNRGDKEDNAELFVYGTEKAMLLAFRQYICVADPEGLTGWNTANFDMPYLAERATQLGIYDRFMDFSRIRGKKTWLRKSTFQSKGSGAREITELLCEGRFDFDALVYVLKMVYRKFRFYNLNYIATILLKKQKVDVHHTQIPILYDSDDDEDRVRLAHYCVRDASLPLELLDKLMAVVNCIEQARVTGVPIKWIMCRGQGVKTFSNLLRYKPALEHTPSRSPKTNSVVTAGGHVEEPMRGFYLSPTISLDFGSLYPSIMIARNICYTTKVSLAWARANLKPEDYYVPYPSVDLKTSEEIERDKISTKKKSKKERDREAAEQAVAGKEPDFCFVKRHIREGVLPRMLEALLAARVHVKNLMKTPEAKADDMYMSVLDGRQNALKVVCNSVYGFLKAFIWRDKDLMAAVTSDGRNMLRIVKDTIKENFTNISVVDVAACLAASMDPEEGPKDGAEDVRPRKLTSAFVVYGGEFFFETSVVSRNISNALTHRHGLSHG